MELVFTEPGSGGPYEEIRWYKGATGSSATRIVFVHQSFTLGKPRYNNKYCSGSSPCESSEKFELDLNTGSLTINKVQLSDEDYYYYDVFTNDLRRFGYIYEIQVEVYGKFLQPREFVSNSIINAASTFFTHLSRWPLFKLDNALLNNVITRYLETNSFLS